MHDLYAELRQGRPSSWSSIQRNPDGSRVHHAISVKAYSHRTYMSCGSEYDLIVVGAGPAGSTVAYFASMGGLRVLLVDRCGFPREKVCSGGLSPRSLTILDEMAVLDQIRPSDHAMIRSVRLGSPNGLVVTGDLPVTPLSRGYGYVVPRFTLDSLIRTQALQKGTAHLQAKVTDILRSNGHADGVIADGREIRAAAIIVAAGARPLVPSASQRDNDSDDSTFFAIQTHFDAPPEPDSTTIVIYFERSLLPGYFWIFPEGHGRVTAGAGTWGNPGGAKALLERYEAGVRYAQAQGRSFIPSSDTLAFDRWMIPTHRVIQPSLASNVLFVGDAGGFANPFTGEGIYYALESGRLAAAAVVEGMELQSSDISISERYEAHLSGMIEDLRMSWCLHDFISDVDRTDTFIAAAARDATLRAAVIGAVINASDKTGLIEQLALTNHVNQ